MFHFLSLALSTSQVGDWGYATFESSSRSIFLFLTGYFDTDDLFATSPLFFLFVTVIFQITILLILGEELFETLN